MTDYGLGPDGFVRKPRSAIFQSIVDRQREKISKNLQADSEKTAIGQINDSVVTEISQCWEAAPKAR